jgi:di/tricarboxylate transporter
VQLDSPLAGKSVAESELARHGVRVLEIIRNEVEISVDPELTFLEEGDRLILSCKPSGLAHARSLAGIALGATRGIGLETISAHEGAIVEGVIGPRSTIIGSTVSEINFRQRFRVILVAIHRRGINLRKKIKDVRFQPGDLLLMMGTDAAIGQLRSNSDILLLDHPHTPARSQRRKIPLVLATVAGVVVVASLNVIPIVAAALIAVAVIFLSGTLKTKESYLSIEWSILFLIYGMLALGVAMQTTGTAHLLAELLISIADIGALPEAWKPQIVLAAFYLLTMVLTETLSNTATVVLMTPLALSLGATLGVDPRGFVIASCIAASASFSTPIGYQTNTYVYGVAGYRFTDFTRAGLPLNALYFVVSVILIPRLWPF